MRLPVGVVCNLHLRLYFFGVIVVLRQGSWVGIGLVRLRELVIFYLRLSGLVMRARSDLISFHTANMV